MTRSRCPATIPLPAIGLSVGSRWGLAWRTELSFRKLPRFVFSWLVFSTCAGAGRCRFCSGNSWRHLPFRQAISKRTAANLINFVHSVYHTTIIFKRASRKRGETMLNDPVKSCRPIHVLPFVACIGFTLAMAVPAAAEGNSCRPFRIAISHNLPDGEQEVSVANTKLGKLTARVQVKDRTVSGKTFFLGGEPFKRASETTLPKKVSACVQTEKRRTAAHHKKARQEAIELVFCDERIRRCIAVVCLENGSCGGATVDY